jgi:hypothetical protein
MPDRGEVEFHTGQVEPRSTWSTCFSFGTPPFRLPDRKVVLGK